MRLTDLRAGRARQVRSRFQRCAFFFFLLLFSLAAGCAKKAPSKSNTRAITHEFVTAAERVAGRRAEIVIRPELMPSGGAVATDHIYITLADPAQKSELTQALEAVARRRGLSTLRATTAAGVVRLDYQINGRRTHAIHIITPVAARLVRQTKTEAGPNLAIILDDLGNDRGAADAALALPFPITVSILPNEISSAEIAEEAHRRGDEVLLHLPMASLGDGAHAEPVELQPGMSATEVARVLAAMLESVPYATGVNNHQGSLATADPQLMEALMAPLRQRELFFIDSRTTALTVAYDAAERAGVRAAFRDVFLDDTQTREAVLAQLALAERDAEKKGWAIAIGHPHSATLAALQEELPKLEARGVHFVFASELAH